MIMKEAIKTLTDDITALAMSRADEWRENGAARVDIGAALMTVASHSAAQIAMAVASDDANPKGFIEVAAPRIARHITEYTLGMMDSFIVNLKKAESTR